MFMNGLLALPALYSLSGSIAGFAHRVGQTMEAIEELTVGRHCHTALYIMSWVDMNVCVTGWAENYR